MSALSFELQHTDQQSKARAGKITTDHGEILTPIFMPVGTAGSVKAVTQQQLVQGPVFPSFVQQRFFDDLRAGFLAPIRLPLAPMSVC